MVVDPHRGVATERLVAAPLLSTSSADRDDVLALAESTGGRESLARQDWGVILTPGYAFTRDGGRKAISRERTNSLSTRRAARDFNPTVLQDVSFWVAVLSGEAEGLFALEHEPSNDLARFPPTIVLSHRTPTISFNVSAFEETSELENEIDEDLRRLDAELEELALEPEGEELDNSMGSDTEDPEEPGEEEPAPDAADDH